MRVLTCESFVVSVHVRLYQSRVHLVSMAENSWAPVTNGGKGGDKKGDHFHTLYIQWDDTDLTITDEWNLGSEENKPICVLVIGMAGSGKSSLVQVPPTCDVSHSTQRIHSYVNQVKYPSYLVNLDPAVANVQFKANIDIKDALNYKEVMKQYNLGPNGGILTSLNLFATRFDQVMGFIDKRAPNLKYAT